MSTYLDGGPSRGASVCRHGSEDPIGVSGNFMLTVVVEVYMYSTVLFMNIYYSRTGIQ